MHYCPLCLRIYKLRENMWDLALVCLMFAKRQPSNVNASSIIINPNMYMYNLFIIELSYFVIRFKHQALLMRNCDF